MSLESTIPSTSLLSRTGGASGWCALQEALYKCVDTIQSTVCEAKPRFKYPDESVFPP